MCPVFKKEVPEEEIKFTFARSSGAGGQNVNKTSTKTILHWNVGKSSFFSDYEKNIIRKKLSNKINSKDEVIIMAEEERSQIQNKTKALARLQALVGIALIIPKKRKPTKPTYSSKLKRLKIKKQRSEIKTSRRVVED